MNLAVIKKLHIKSLAGLLIVSSASLIDLSETYAMDALQVLPTRIVMSNQRSSELTLVNKGTDEGSYRIILRNIRTDIEGKFTVAEKAQEGELFADKLIRFSPRRVNIEGGSFQKVRVMVRKPKGLAEGEYRTHMVFQSLPKQDANTLDETGELSVSVDPIVEVSIPIIVRNGKLDAEIKIEKPAISDSKMAFTLLRDGTRSIYGDVEILVNSGPLKGNRVGYIRGISVYYPNDRRNLRIPLQLPEGFNVQNHNLAVSFTEDPTYGGDSNATAIYKP